MSSTRKPDEPKIYYVQCRNSEKLKKITNQIKRLVKRLQLTYIEYTPTVVRRLICQNSPATKKETFKIIASQYPELITDLNPDRLGKDKYWDQMLNAVALGVCCWKKLNQ